MNIVQLFENYNIPFTTEGKNSLPGWINIQCAFCDDSSNHLGYNLKQNYFHCWKCGWHGISQTITKLLNISEQEAKTIIQQYGGFITYKIKEPAVKIRAKAHRLPSNTMPLQANHKRYLESRGFDPDLLEHEWHLVGTGPISTLDGINYKHRIIAPIIWDNQQVSFQSRDITNRQTLKYITCPKDRELIHHKNILYGKQQNFQETGICTEGITDVWRFGTIAFATFGIEYTPTQIRTIAKSFKRVFVVFDGGESIAQQQANKLVADLKFRGVEAFRIDIEGDPGAMDQQEADYLVKQLIT